MLTLECSEEEKILEKRPGKIIGINKEFEVIEIELDADHSTSTVHKCWCVGFKPKLGDKVIEVITNYGWRVEKSPYSSVESEQVATNEKVGSSSLSRGKRRIIMPVINLTMNQWSLVLRTIRHMLRDHGVPESERKELAIAEDRIIDMAFKSAKEMEAMNTSKKDPRQESWELLAERHARDTQEEKEKKFVCPVGQQI